MVGTYHGKKGTTRLFDNYLDEDRQQLCVLCVLARERREEQFLAKAQRTPRMSENGAERDQSQVSTFLGWASSCLNQRVVTDFVSV